MIRSLNNLSVGQYVGDFRADEGVRIREEFISPTLTANSGGGMTHMILLVEVEEDENQTSD